MNEVSPQPSLLDADQTQLHQAFFLREMLHCPAGAELSPPLSPTAEQPRGYSAPPWTARLRTRTTPALGAGAAPSGPRLCGAGPASPRGYRSRRYRGRAEAGRNRRRLMTCGRPVTRNFPGPRGGAASVVRKLQRFAPKPAPHAHTRSERATGTWRQAGTQPRALPAAAAFTQRGRSDASPPRGRGDGCGARCRAGQRRGRKRRTGWLHVCPSSRGHLPDFQWAGCRELVPRVRDVQGLAPRHRQQRVAVAAPLPGRALRLPAGDRLRPREWLFLEGKSTSSGWTPAVTLTRMLGTNRKV